MKRSIDLSCRTPACSPEMKDTLRKASELPHLGQVSMTLGCSLLDSSITSMGEGACGSIVVISAASTCTICPHLEQTKPFLVARIYEPHFSQNFMLPLHWAIVVSLIGLTKSAGLRDPYLQSSRFSDRIDARFSESEMWGLWIYGCWPCSNIFIASWRFCSIS